MQVTINVAAGTYTPNSASGFRLDKYAKELSISLSSEDIPKCHKNRMEPTPKGNSKSDGNETIFMPLNNKGGIFDLSEKVKGCEYAVFNSGGKPKWWWAAALLT